MNATKQRRNLNIGALWLSETREGVEYFSGHITTPDGQTYDVSVFKNKFKGVDDQKPHFIVWTPDLSDLPEVDNEPALHPF